ncbi:ABC transporter substrate-binding protein [Carnobacterium divergens]|nr:Bacterial extracellular solute-binding protein [Carnobacterium divergens]SPC41738.1 ABC transporter substrate-binding protein [Carnobacterium divergens]
MVKMKSLAVGVSLVALTAVVLGACGGKNAENDGGKDFSIADRYKLDKTKPAWELDKKEEPTTLTWYLNSDWKTIPFGDDVTTAQIKKDLNIDVKFITGDDTKLNTMFSGGDMPDIVTLFDPTSSAAKKANTWAYPLDDLAKKYDPYFKSVTYDQTFKWYQLDDGKTYGYPNYSNTQEDYDSGVIPVNTNFIIRQDIYEALGKPSVATQAEFENVMNQIKEKYPELTPFGFSPLGDSTGSLGEPLQDWLGVPLEKDGKFYDRNLDKDYLSWVKTLNKVYRDGNISDDSFADDGPTFDEKIKSGKYATLFINGTSGLVPQLQTFSNNNKGNAYMAIDGPKSTLGNEPTLNQTGISGWLVNYITKDAKDPAKAIQLFTYLLDKKGQILTRYGVEGETYQYNQDGKIEFLPEVLKLKEDNPVEYSEKYRISEFLYFNHDRNNALGVGSTDASVNQMQEWGKGKLKPHFIIENTNPDAGTPEARSFDGIKTKWSTALVGMIRSKDDAGFDKKLADYKTFLKENNWDKIEKVRNEKMKENKEKLETKD